MFAGSWDALLGMGASGRTGGPVGAVSALADAGADAVILLPPKDATAAYDQMALAA